MQLLAAQGLTLTNYYGTTHPSEPNYCAIYGGDHFGMDNDNFHQIPANVSNIWDLLAAKGISFAAYQENIPYTGFQGFQYVNPGSGANNYVRKHDPPVLFNSNAEKQERMDVLKDFVAFQNDLANNDLPQHIFITPNMLNDAHDTGITYGADWLFTFVSPLLDDKFFMNKTLLIINFDEDGTDTISNRVMSIILSDVLPESLVGATDDNVYTHYSNLATVEANWDLDTLGRWDVAANVYNFVAEVTGDKVRPPQVPVGDFFLNQSYPGPFAVSLFGPMPVPNTTMEVNGRKVFDDVVDQWGHLQECTSYDADSVVPPDGLRPPKAIPSSCFTLHPSPLPTTKGGHPEPTKPSHPGDPGKPGYP
jgi:acid phosphatase